MTIAPHLVPICAVRISGKDHHERGLARGRGLATSIRATARSYTDHFTRLGISAADQQEAAEASLSALHSWGKNLHEEVRGIAEGADLDLTTLGRTIARTEILTLAPGQPGECSTLAYQAPGRSVSAQTWDWYADFVTSWHLHRVDPVRGEVAHAGFAEYGMPGKIGLNAAGVGVHLNILAHRDDAPGGVPIHAVLARILSEATTVEHGIELIRSAPTSSSSALTLTSADRVAMVEVSPGQVSVQDGPGWLLHTNHFGAPEHQDGALVLARDCTSHDRLEFLQSAVTASPIPQAADDLIPLMCSPLEADGVALLPDPARPAQERVATLVTVQMDPAARSIRLSPGVPQFAEEVSVTYRL